MNNISKTLGIVICLLILYWVFTTPNIPWSLYEN